MIESPIPTTLNASTYTVVKTTKACKAFGFWTEDGSGFYLATDSSGTDAVLVPESFPLSIEKDQAINAELLYAKAVSGTPILAVVITK